MLSWWEIDVKIWLYYPYQLSLQIIYYYYVLTVNSSQTCYMCVCWSRMSLLFLACVAGGIMWVARLEFWRRSRVPKKGTTRLVFLAASPLVTSPPSNLTRLYYNGSATKSHSTTTQYRQLRGLCFSLLLLLFL